MNAVNRIVANGYRKEIYLHNRFVEEAGGSRKCALCHGVIEAGSICFSVAYMGGFGRKSMHICSACINMVAAKVNIEQEKRRYEHGS